ncbi:Tat pathway signal sequence domain protein [Streptomyces mirabilis]|uniref:Tat pathway signal sequence domain protein n=1 Tax=Streptomyces mirabilis TaxID=68239 RepID=UPI003653E3FA
MPTPAPSRRTVLTGLATGAAAALTAGLPLPGTARAASATAGTNAYAFLAARFDQYGTGTTLRVPQSYTGGYFATIGFVSSFTYDNALVILAWLASGTSANIQRATVLGDTLLYAQAHDPIGDGRTRASYQPDSFTTLTGSLDIGSPAANTGNQAWTGIALARLYQVTGLSRFLQGAVSLANWIHTTTWDGTKAPHGYTGGRDGDNVAYTFKATEHNIDTGAFFTMLGTLTGVSTWTTRAQAAYAFVAAMQNTSTGYVYTGTATDGVTVNPSPVPEDVQTWAYLATGDVRYSPSVTWVLSTLAASDAGFGGCSYSTADTSKVWFEGTAHLALAVRARGATGDPARYTTLIGDIESAQSGAANGDGQGIVAASSDGLLTGFGDTYYASLHTGATAWYLLAAAGYNPFRL